MGTNKEITTAIQMRLKCKHQVSGVPKVLVDDVYTGGINKNTQKQGAGSTGLLSFKKMRVWSDSEGSNVAC